MNRISPLHRKPLRSSISEAEWTARVDLAAAYRLADLYGMSDMIYTHISARVPGQPDHFLINAHGMLFDEITASSLLKVAGFVIHSALYKARPDIMAAMHTHTVAGMAVSSMKCGMIPLTQTSTRFYTRIAYHDFNGPERDPGERDHLARDLGSHNLMILRNHGLLTVGPSVAEAFNYMYGMERSCEAQLAAMSANTELNYLPQEVVDKAVAMYEPGVIRPYGILEWPALLRKLDRLDPSYRD